jgi:hypothetical protein
MSTSPDLSFRDAATEPFDPARPPSSTTRAMPPPLPETPAPPPHSERVAADEVFAERMLECLAGSDYAGALIAAEALLETHPGHQDLLDTAQIARSELRRRYVARLGSLDRAPRLAMDPDGLATMHSLDFRSGLVLSRVDGRATLAEIVESSGLTSFDSLRILSELYLRRAIVLAE